MSNSAWETTSADIVTFFSLNSAFSRHGKAIASLLCSFGLTKVFFNVLMFAMISSHGSQVESITCYNLPFSLFWMNKVYLRKA